MENTKWNVDDDDRNVGHIICIYFMFVLLTIPTESWYSKC
jgi:hypothetical protein